MPDPGSLVELRVLEGPNLYFPRAAVKLTLDVGAILDATEEDARRLATGVGLARARPGARGSAFRQRFASRAVEALVRRVASGAGTTRLAVRVRPTGDVRRVVAAYPWRRRARAEALGEAVADLLDRVPDAPAAEAMEALVAEAARRVREAEPGPPPATLRPRIPVVAVTGTNGKTTTSRMVAHIGRAAGLHVGWSSTDGVYVDGVLVEEGDYSGPGGAARVLAHPGVQLAVTETARGGILLKGIGVTHNDVSVVTNISADHLGLQGIDTLDQLAEVKGVVPRITRREGWAVLNGDDPRVLGMRARIPARTWLFTMSADSPGAREVLAGPGRVTTVLDGWITVLRPGQDPEPLVEVAEVPMTLAGLSRVNVENAMAAASAALALGLPSATVAEGLRSFLPDAEHNPGRMNVFTLEDGVTVVMDLAHNEAGLEALLATMAGLRAPGGRLLIGLGAVGDRTDEMIANIAEAGARDTDVAVIAHKRRYLRGRTPEALEALFRQGAARVGVTALAAYDDELSALHALVAQARAGDVVGLMCHAQRDEVHDWLSAHGTPDDPATLRRKARAAAGSTLPTPGPRPDSDSGPGSSPG